MVGLKWTVPIVSVLMLGFLAVNALLLWQFVQPYEPLGSYPVQAVTSRVPGVDGPATYYGDPVIMIGTKCLNSKEPVTVTSQSAWVSKDNRNPTVFISRGKGDFIRPVGCVTRTFVNSLPPEATPGMWRFEGTDTATQGNKTQVKAYWSQDFLIVAKPR